MTGTQSKQAVSHVFATVIMVEEGLWGVGLCNSVLESINCSLEHKISAHQFIAASAASDFWAYYTTTIPTQQQQQQQQANQSLNE
jgi:hypothetical protein